MREDLDFLYRKAMRSNDFEFMDEVYMLLEEYGWTVESNELSNRMFKFMCHEVDSWPDSSKFDFLTGDSELGQAWYTNKENI